MSRPVRFLDRAPGVALRVIAFCGIVVLIFAVGNCNGLEERAAVSGVRGVLRATVVPPSADSPAGVAGAGAGAGVAGAGQVAAGEAAPTVVPTRAPVVVGPSPTPDVAPGDAAPAVPGSPIVVGIRPDGFQGPDVIRSGIQTWALVNVSDADVTVAIVDASMVDAAGQISQGTAFVFQSDVIGSGRSVNVEVDLDAGNWVRVVFDASGEPTIVGPFRVVG